MATGTAIPLAQYLSSSYEPDCDYVDGELEERNVGERTHARLQARITAYLLTHYEAQGIEVFTEVRVQVSPTRFRIPDVCATIGDPGEEVLTQPPSLCVEILSPEDRMSRLDRAHSRLPSDGRSQCVGSGPADSSSVHSYRRGRIARGQERCAPDGKPSAGDASSGTLGMISESFVARMKSHLLGVGHPSFPARRPIHPSRTCVVR